MKYHVDYKYQYEPNKSRSFDTFEEAEAFAKKMRAQGWDAIIEEPKDGVPGWTAPYLSDYEF